MTLNHEYAIPHLEWEFVEFPMLLKQPVFEYGSYLFDDETTVSIWREPSLQLKGKITGRPKNPRLGDGVQMVGKGIIMRQEIIRAKDLRGHTVILRGCALGSHHFNSYEVNDEGYLMDIELIFDTAQVTFSERQATRHFEWFLVQHISPHFFGTTIRSMKRGEEKIRVGIDIDPDSERLLDRSMTKDYFVIELQEMSCIVAKVPKAFTGNEIAGICIEFRDTDIGKVDKTLLKDLENFLSFLLGGRFFNMGYSRLAGDQLTEAFLDSPDIPLKVPAALPAIRYNLQYDWGNFALQVNLLFPKYRELQRKLFLNHVIERYWIANELPVGVNLPVLAGALEIIASAYLKMSGNDQSEYLSGAVYSELIKEELQQLQVKLSGLDGGEIMLNKFKSAFRKGPNEKMTLFFTLLGLEIAKPEKEAIKLRNKMTHGRRDYENIENAHDDVVSTRVYQALFNRIILKLLGYDGYYIDYSVTDMPLTHI